MKKFLTLLASLVISCACAFGFSACGENGRDGINGTNGVNGTDGKDGADGVGIENVYFDDDGNLIVVLTNGNKLNAGKTEAYENFYFSEIWEGDEVVGYSVRSIGNLSGTKLTIPATYKGKPVKEIGEGAFLSCRFLNEITIPDSVKIICRYAFENCSGLKKVDLGKGVEYIGDASFSYCSSLTEISVPSSVRFIGSNAFSGCSSLKDVNIEEGVKRMGRTVFTGCDSLEEITIPESVTEVGIDYTFTDNGLTISIVTDGDYSLYAMFMNCGNLRKVHLPENFPEIPERFFSGCMSLEEVYLGKSITKIGYSAFYSIDRLKSIVIPKSVKEVSSYAFYRVNALEDVFYEGTKEEWDEIKINRNNEISGYNPETGAFTNEMTKLYFYSETQPAEGTDCWHYVNGQPTKW